MKLDFCCRLMAAVSLASLAGCTNPYGQSVASVSYAADPAAGEILISSPKLYKREALINERREEVNYLATLIEGSKSAEFGPEIVRELEVIRAISASVGLKFDPASGAAYRRTEEKAEIQQQLDMIALGMQLDKLKREAELLKTALAAQTVPTPGAGGAQGATVTVNPVTTASVTELLAALKTLTDRLGTTGGTGLTALKGVDVKANPIDVFQDRAVYRDLINNARNAASLDELHDRDGSALIRLNMTATVFPPDKQRRASFGRLRLDLEAPVVDPASPEIEALYRDWMSYISPQMSQPFRDAKDNFAGYEPSSLSQALLQLGVVDVVPFEFSRGAGAGCAGLATDGVSVRPGCRIIWVAAPPIRLPANIAGASRQGSISVGELGKLPLRADSFIKTDFARFLAAETMTLFEPGCSLAPESLDYPGPGLSPGATVTIAAAAERILSIAPLVEQRAQIGIRSLDAAARIDSAKAGPIYFSPIGPVDPALLDQARAVMRKARDLARVQCARAAQPAFFAAQPPGAFLDRLAYGTVGVYQLGPKQQVQTVSTEARAAESIALAASIAAQAPGKGIGGDGAFGFSRSAAGRADALERVPLVVAFADAGWPAGRDGAQSGAASLPGFGWMMGPRATLDTERKRIDFAQGLRPQELTADLVVPGWWPYLTLRVASTWAPAWTGNEGKAAVTPVERRVRVPLAPSSADFEQLTNQILGGGSLKVPQIRTVEPAALPACASAVAVQLRGPNIWRADKVIVGGRIISGDKLSVLAGMEGLLVEIDKADFPVSGSSSVAVTALTPYGPADFSLPFIGGGKGCPPADGGKAGADGSAKAKG
ncbi:hypothetical protein [Sphingopyxis sp. YR583]|uniref:hypothetical protein n=1 Tax=Sphingopyxis sp. YR583 TaxID=1881047 RepID=UPI00115F8106|nr:hypothetical protein [Sphingopyxis sp. YR583]